MGFQISKEQQMIQQMAREFARKELAEKAADRDKNHEYPADSLKKMGELGLLGMLVSETYGGEDMGTVAYSLALSEIAYACASTAVIMSVHNSICCGSLERFGTEEQKETFLRPMAAGEIIGAFALTEPEAGSDPQSMACTAEKDGNHYLINGTKRFITSGKNGGVTILLARTAPTGSKGITAFLITPDLPGFEVGRVEDKMGQCASDTVDLNFTNCRVPASRMLGKEGEGFLVAMSGLDAGRIGIASLALGIGTAALDEAKKYARKREQFGKPISEFQGIRWMLADMAMDVEAARLLVLNAAATKERGENCTAQASMAKCYASEMAQRVTGQGIQIHGGYGYTKEYPVERFYRDARITTIYEGTNQVQRIVIANDLMKDQKKKRKNKTAA
ncbi:acyl-CoA dehydrogenase family protein [Desulfoluna spongiiphila]|uniref:Cyclohex-1-ene-1-carbonyl-CoA dehydrogenase n=1 Tax=Desulfoluna spongiiphila TaxID=419481 RepID=A0A1G5FXP3_9BACT|nr:acyl-CoA dehydrogenase family protein [Desulfoluna spongiiphila]SCY43328.1 butyryl-CoA dehydrogenase [Desulfoluna spongiiphila]VVS91356.1 acyl-coa dehydrogenase/oxidase c-terminal [Desulfoluna spongiiphila]